MMNLMKLAETGSLPDGVVRFGIRKLLRDRLKLEVAKSAGDPKEARKNFLEMMKG